jgi:hypothetical protein
MRTRSLTLVGLLIALSLMVSSAQGNLSISGTVFARAGSSVKDVVVIACLILKVEDGCDDAGSQTALPGGDGVNVTYQLPGLAAKDYLLLAWRDLNANQELDQGDELGVYQKSGKPALVRPPAQKIDLKLLEFNGDLGSILEQADQAPAQPSAPAATGLAFSGTVKSVAGSGLENAIVLAGVWENGKYNQGKSKAIKLGTNGQFSVSGLEKIPYVLFAWRDLDGNGDVSPADEVAPFRVNGKPALATPPLTNIALQFEKGDSSLDALVALTLPGANTGSNKPTNPAPSSPAATNPGALTTIDCGKKEAFYGDYGCIIPPVESYLGNTKCPLGPSFPGVKQEKGFFTGYVYDSCNRPMANVEISAHQEYGRTNTTRTDGKGFYRVESQYIVGAFVYATIKAKSDGNEYSFTVYPKERIYGNDGGIQNIHYDTRDSGLWFYPQDFYRFDFAKEATIEFVLEPIKLLDGTTGRTQTFRYKDVGGAFKFHGIKYGQYNVTAFLITPTTRYKTFLSTRGGPENVERIPVTIVGTDVVQVTLKLEP